MEEHELGKPLPREIWSVHLDLLPFVTIIILIIGVIDSETLDWGRCRRLIVSRIATDHFYHVHIPQRFPFSLRLVPLSTIMSQSRRFLPIDSNERNRAIRLPNSDRPTYKQHPMAQNSEFDVCALNRHNIQQKGECMR